MYYRQFNNYLIKSSGGNGPYETQQPIKLGAKSHRKS